MTGQVFAGQQVLGGQELEGASKSHDLALREGQSLAGAGLSKDA